MHGPQGSRLLCGHERRSAQARQRLEPMWLPYDIAFERGWATGRRHLHHARPAGRLPRRRGSLDHRHPRRISSREAAEDAADPDRPVPRAQTTSRVASTVSGSVELGLTDSVAARRDLSGRPAHRRAGLAIWSRPIPIEWPRTNLVCDRHQPLLLEEFRPSIRLDGVACLAWVLYVAIRYIVIYWSGDDRRWALRRASTCCRLSTPRRPHELLYRGGFSGRW